MMKKVLFIVSLFVTASLYAGQVTITRDVSSLASEYGWEQGSGTNCYLKFALDENITLYASSGNAKYLKNDKEECMRYYQYGKGELTIRAKAGVIIQSVQFDYYNTGVITNNYGTDGTSTPEANQVKSGVPFKVDGNKVELYMGSTDNTKSEQVRITKYSVTYFVPEENATVFKTAADLGKNLGLKNNTPYQDIALNNAIKLHADNGGTLKYYTSGKLNCYRWTGAIDIVARKGVKINYVKVTFNGGPRAVLTQNWGKDGKAISAVDRIASDSMLYVNADSLKLYVGDTTLLGTKSGTSPSLEITKIYVNYVDSDAVVEYFNDCPVASSDDTVAVAGVNGIYDWKITNFNRDSACRVSYDQSIMLRQTGGKLEMVNKEGGIKEVYFDWFGTNKDNGVKFTVKAGVETFVVDSPALGDYNRILFSKSGIKSNGAFSIEMDPTSGSQLEVGPISITPYLRFAMREDSINTENATMYDVKGILIDNTEDAANIVYSIESDATGGAAISGGVLDLNGSLVSGAIVVQATWEGVAVHFTLNVKVAGTQTGCVNLNDNDNHNLRKVVVNGEVRIYRNGEVYSVLGQKF